MAVPRPTVAILEGTVSLTWCLITAFVQFRHEGHWDSHNEVGSLRLAERLVGFEPETLWFEIQCLNPIGHSPHINLNGPLKSTNCKTMKFYCIFSTQLSCVGSLMVIGNNFQKLRLDLKSESKGIYHLSSVNLPYFEIF